MSSEEVRRKHPKKKQIQQKKSASEQTKQQPDRTRVIGKQLQLSMQVLTVLKATIITINLTKLTQVKTNKKDAKNV